MTQPWIVPLDSASGNLRQRHAHGRRAQAGEHLVDLPRRRAHLDALQVAHGLHRLVRGVDDARPVHLQRDHLRVLELVGRHGLHVLPIGLGRGFGIAHDERQLEHLDAREAAGRVAGQRPHHVDHAVARLVVQLHRRAAQLHGRIGLELDAAARVLLDLVHPRLVHVQPDVGRGRHEGVELERDRLLREGAEGRGAERRGDAGLEEGSALDHGFVLCLKRRHVSGKSADVPP